MRGFPAGGDGFVAPDVIDGRFVGWEEDRTVAASQAYVPATVGDTEVLFHLWHTGDGRLAFPVYTTVQDLVRCCGAEQPWVGVYADRVDDCAKLCAADLVVWNAEVTV